MRVMWENGLEKVMSGSPRGYCLCVITLYQIPSIFTEAFYE